MNSGGSQYGLSHAISYLQPAWAVLEFGRPQLAQRGGGHHARRRFAATASVSDVVDQEAGTGERERNAETEVRLRPECGKVFEDAVSYLARDHPFSAQKGGHHL
jgi:hypothetical protein